MLQELGYFGNKVENYGGWSRVNRMERKGWCDEKSMRGGIVK